jgi:hypothetical protein
MLYKTGFRISSKFKSMILDSGSEDNDPDKNIPDLEHCKESARYHIFSSFTLLQIFMLFKRIRYYIFWYFTYHRQVDVGGVHSNDHQKFS